MMRLKSLNLKMIFVHILSLSICWLNPKIEGNHEFMIFANGYCPHLSITFAVVYNQNECASFTFALIGSPSLYSFNHKILVNHEP
jgi:hypothetical protein